MNNERLAIRYSKSLYVLSEKQNNTDVVLRDLKEVLSIVKQYINDINGIRSFCVGKGKSSTVE